MSLMSEAKSILLLLVLAISTYIKIDIHHKYPARSIAQIKNLGCYDLINQIFAGQHLGQIRNKRFPYGTNAPDEHFRFSLKAKFDLNDEQLLAHININEAQGIDVQEWTNLNVQEQIQWLQSNIEDVAEFTFSFKQVNEHIPVETRIVFSQDKKFHLELSELNTLEEWVEGLRELQRLGKSDLSASIIGKSDFILKDNQLSPEQIKDINLGFLNFYHDYDILQKLSLEYQKTINDPAAEIAKNFVTTNMGPTNKNIQNELNQLLQNAANGANDDLAPIYSAGIEFQTNALGNAVFNINDNADNVEILFEKMLRLTYFLEHNRQVFSQFSQWDAFDPEVSFSSLPQPVKELLTNLYPDDTTSAAQNLSWPLRNWDKQLQTINKADITDAVTQAQHRYIEELSLIQNNLQEEVISVDTARLQTQNALGKFAHDSKLYDSLHAIESGFANNTVTGIDQQAVNLVLKSDVIEQLKDFYPNQMWDGNFLDRVQHFRAKHQASTRVIDNVNFAYKNSENITRKSQKHQVLLISGVGLSEAEKTQLLKDYYETFSHNTISFPTRSNFRHLMFRMGDQIVDYDLGRNILAKEFRMPDSDNLETFFSLSDREFQNIRTYIKNAQDNPNEVIGNFNLNGANSGVTNRQLTNNQPLTAGEGHNCTSVLCTAPIGEAGEDFIDLAGSNRAIDIHTNAGWWTSWLNGGAPVERVPLVVYWIGANKNIDEIAAKVATDAEFDWIYGRQ